MKVKKLIQSCDKVGPKFELNFGKESSFQSVFGGLLSLTAYVFIGLAFYSFIYKLFDSKQVEVSSSSLITREAPQIDLYESAIYPIFGISPAGGSLVETANFEKYIHLTGVITTLEYDSLTEDTLTTQVEKTINFVPCKDLDLPILTTLQAGVATIKEFSDLFGMCLDIRGMNDYFVKGNKIDPPFRSLVIKVGPCRLPSPMTDCENPYQLNGGELSIILPEYGFDPENKKNPITITPVVDHSLFLDLNVINVKKYKIGTSELYDDTRDFAEPELRKVYAEVDRSITSLYRRNFGPNAAPVCGGDTVYACVPFAELHFEASGKKVVIIRKYQKIFNTLGEMGGIRQLIMLAVALIYSLYSCFFKPRAMKNAIFKQSPKDMSKYLGGKGNLKEVKKLRNEVLADDQDGIEMLKTLNFVTFFEEIAFQGNERVLLPLLITQKKLNEAKKEKDDKAARSLKTLEKKKNKGKKKGNNPEKTKNNEPKEVGVEEAYKRLVDFKPKTKVDELIKEYMIKNCPESLKKTTIANEQIKVEDVGDKPNGGVGGKQIEMAQFTPVVEFMKENKEKTKEANSEGLSVIGNVNGNGAFGAGVEKPGKKTKLTIPIGGIKF